MPKSTRQISRGLGFGILRLHGVEHQKPLVGVLVALTEHSRVLLHFEDEAGQFAAFPGGHLAQFSGYFGFAHKNKLEFGMGFASVVAPPAPERILRAPGAGNWNCSRRRRSSRRSSEDIKS